MYPVKAEMPPSRKQTWTRRLALPAERVGETFIVWEGPYKSVINAVHNLRKRRYAYPEGHWTFRSEPIDDTSPKRGRLYARRDSIN